MNYAFASLENDLSVPRLLSTFLEKTYTALEYANNYVLIWNVGESLCEYLYMFTSKYVNTLETMHNAMKWASHFKTKQNQINPKPHQENAMHS